MQVFPKTMWHRPTVSKQGRSSPVVESSFESLSSAGCPTNALSTGAIPTPTPAVRYCTYTGSAKLPATAGSTKLPTAAGSSELPTTTAGGATTPTAISTRKVLTVRYSPGA